MLRMGPICYPVRTIEVQFLLSLFRRLRLIKVSNQLRKTRHRRFKGACVWNQDQHMFPGVFVSNGGKRGKVKPVEDGKPRVWSEGYCRKPVINYSDQLRLHTKYRYVYHLWFGVSYKIHW